MDYIAVMDYEHLDNGMFLTAFAQALASQKLSRGVIIHGDSAYTERLMQTGMLREDAVVRSVKDLNHRLIALLADHGIAAIGLNGYQRSLIRQSGSEVHIDTGQLNRLPSSPHLLISNLVDSASENRPRPLELPLYAAALCSALDISELLVFSLDDTEEIIRRKRPDTLYKNQLDAEFLNSRIPEEFRDISMPFRITTAGSFADYPSKKGTTLILPDT
ncbi:MAG: hypothetical protein WEC12_05155 [Balneolaceae bacterium]